MSDQKKGMGLFINKKAAAGAAAAAPAAPAGKPKDVKKRWMMVGGGLIGLVVLSTTILGPKQQQGPSEKQLAEQKKKENPTINVNPMVDTGAKSFQEAYSKDQQLMKEQMARLEQRNKAQEDELKALRDQQNKPAAKVPEGIVPPPQMNNQALGGTIGGTPVVMPPKPPIGTAPVIGLPSPPVTPATGGVPPVIQMDSAPMVFDAPGSSSSSGSTVSNPTAAALNAAAGGPESKAKRELKKNPNAGMLPAGAFAPVVLLNGLDAGTSSTTQTSPQPVLMNVQDYATLPGAAKYKLRNCFVLGTGYGDLSAERVYIRFSRLSCVDRDNRLVLTQDVAGYVVDSDGKLGMRGLISDRQGAKLGKAMLAGFTQGLAGALGAAQSTVSQNLTTGTSTSSLGGGNALRASGLQGAQAATAQLAEFYLKEAQNIFPVISLDVGRTGTIVFTNSVALNWGTGDSQYVQQVSPTN